MILGKKVDTTKKAPKPPEWIPDPNNRYLEISTANPSFKRTRLPLPPPAPVDIDILSPKGTP